MPVAGGSSGTQHNIKRDLCLDDVTRCLAMRVDSNSNAKRIEDEALLCPAEAGEIVGDSLAPCGDIVECRFVVDPQVAASEYCRSITLQLIALRA